jgi:hypothetical protein
MKDRGIFYETHWLHSYIYVYRNIENMCLNGTGIFARRVVGTFVREPEVFYVSIQGTWRGR